MLHFSQARVIFVLLICLVAFLFAMPNFFPKEVVERWPSFLPKRQLALGLDLKGGAHLLLAMDTETLRKDWIATLRDDARKQLRDAKISFTAVGTTPTAVQIRLAKPEDADAAVRELRKLNQSLGSLLLGTESNSIDVEKGEGGLVTLRPTPQGLSNRISGAASAALETVRRRVDIIGTTEPLIVRQGSDRILVQVPGFDDTRRLKELIGNTAKLSFHEVHPQMTAEEARATRVPIGYKIYPAAEKNEAAYLLRETPVVPGDDLVDAQPGFDSRTNEPVINFRFNQSGARRFGAFTRDNVGRPFAIVLDDKVLSAPVIREPILGGSGQISGSFTIESANTLAVQLRSGALPTKLTVIEERTVGPSLGADSVAAGTTAGIIGMIATVIMTVVAYGTFGVIAVIGLAVHAISILALMSAIGTTLTLPGIAGFVLTISMAIDANVLIYERIREELRAGKTAVSAIDAGFTRAFVAIFDSQLTTLAAAVIMFWLGSGPIRGFAVTLTLGILTSVFAAVTVTRMLVALWLRSARARSRAIEVPI
ncbi:MAG TPA: protein translocase subunit SecD [Hyphomicrobiaceae bacterium]|nr:protein translocase subunit SecD [Hyphomicrobiaceae bacterium]